MAPFVFSSDPRPCFFSNLSSRNGDFLVQPEPRRASFPRAAAGLCERRCDRTRAHHDRRRSQKEAKMTKDDIVGPETHNLFVWYVSWFRRFFFSSFRRFFSSLLDVLCDSENHVDLRTLLFAYFCQLLSSLTCWGSLATPAPIVYRIFWKTKTPWSSPRPKAARSLSKHINSNGLQPIDGGLDNVFRLGFCCSFFQLPRRSFVRLQVAHS